MNRLEHLLTALAEEGSEVAQRCTKALRFGAYQVEEGQELTNVERIDQEIQDFFGAMELLRDELGVMSDFGKMDLDAIRRKREKITHFMHLAHATGALVDE